jgi:(p)ppGpp synthase/HD superfamily hydrolase
LGTRFIDALTYAADLHKTQARKGTEVPYVSHLLAVASLVLEHGGDEDTTIAALLHDAVEDQGGEPILREIASRFGARVAGIVSACSDTDATPKPPWKARKAAYIHSIAHKDDAALLVSLADKVHNARCILRDYRVVGESVWQRFTGGREGQLWYYKELRDAFRRRTPTTLWRELDQTVNDLESLMSAMPVHQ